MTADTPTRLLRHGPARKRSSCRRSDAAGRACLPRQEDEIRSGWDRGCRRSAGTARAAGRDGHAGRVTLTGLVTASTGLAARRMAIGPAVRPGLRGRWVRRSASRVGARRTARWWRSGRLLPARHRRGLRDAGSQRPIGRPGGLRIPIAMPAGRWQAWHFPGGGRVIQRRGRRWVASTSGRGDLGGRRKRCGVDGRCAAAPEPDGPCQARGPNWL